MEVIILIRKSTKSICVVSISHVNGPFGCERQGPEPVLWDGEVEIRFRRIKSKCFSMG